MRVVVFVVVVVVVCFVCCNATTTTCPVGYFCPSDDVPTPCPTGHYCVIGFEFPTPCPSGTFSNTPEQSGISSCSACPQGSFCLSGSSEPSPCPPGTFGGAPGLVSAEECSDCSAGYFCPGGLEQVSLEHICPVGYYCPERTAHSGMFPCPEGTHNPSTGSGSRSSCIECSNGKFCPSEGEYFERGCPLGAFCVQNSSVATPCPSGTFGPAVNQSACQECSAGWYCEEGSEAPTSVCPPGHYCPAGTRFATEFPCANGTSESSTGRSTPCEDCNAGEYCFGPGNTGSQICPAGHFCPVGTHDPFPCPPGYFDASGGLGSAGDCTDCPPGYYCDGGQTSVSGECPRGYYCPINTESRDQHPCPQGTFNDRLLMEDSSACQLCPPTTYGSRPGLSSDCKLDDTCLEQWQLDHQLVNSQLCTFCTGGYFCDSSGLATVSGKCPDDHYCPPGTNTPIPCQNLTGVSNVQFTDTDSNSGTIGGWITWDSGMYQNVTVVVYASTDGFERSLRLSYPLSLWPFPQENDLDFEAGRFFVEPGTSILSSQHNFTTPQQIIVVTKNNNGETCGLNVASTSLVDLTAPSNVTFFDENTEPGVIGGVVQWVAGVAATINHYSVFLSNGGEQSTQLITTTTSTTVTISQQSMTNTSHVFVVMTTDNSDYKSAPLLIVDRGVPFSNVHSVRFTDTDHVTGQIGGKLTWAESFETGTDDILEYAVFSSADGSVRSMEVTNETTRVPFGQNYFVVPDGLAFEGYLIVVSGNSVGLSVAQASASVGDFGGPVTAGGEVTFEDTDLSRDHLAGWVRWLPPSNTDRIEHYRIYGSSDGTERTQELSSGFGYDYSRVLIGEATAFFVETGTDAADFTHFLVVAANEFGEAPTAGSVAILDKFVTEPPSNLLASPLSATAIALTWDLGDANSFIVERLDHSGVERYDVVGVVSTANFTDTTVQILDSGVNMFTYRVFAGIDGSFESVGSYVSAMPAARVIRERIEDFRVVQISSNSLVLRWSPDFRASHYYIKMKQEGSNLEYSDATTAAAAKTFGSDFDDHPGHLSLSFETTIENLASNTTYHFQLIASNVHGNQTENIPTVTGKTSSTQPVGVQLVVGHATRDTIPLAWITDYTATHYQVDVREAHQDDDSFVTVASNLLEAHFTTAPPLNPNTNYILRVSSVNNFGSAVAVANATTKGGIVEVGIQGGCVTLEPGTTVQLGSTDET